MNMLARWLAQKSGTCGTLPKTGGQKIKDYQQGK
jgi:hypothetical protein